MKIKTYLFYSSFLWDFFFNYKKQNCGCAYCSLPYPKVTILWLGIIVWFQFGHDCWQLSDFPGDSLVKLFACQCGRCRRCGCEPWVGKISWRRKWQPTQYSCLENPMDRGAWQAIAHGIARVRQDLATKPPPWKKSYDQPKHIKEQRYYFANKGPSSESYGFFQ